MTASSPANRRAEARHAVRFEVDCTSGDTFLFAHITDISSMGIFISTATPMPVGTVLKLAFTPPAGADGVAAPRLELTGEVMWNTTGQVAPGKPGMGVRFHRAAPKTRERLLELVRAIAYLDDPKL